MTLKNNPWDHLGELVGTIASLCGCDVEGGSEGAGVGITESKASYILLGLILMVHHVSSCFMLHSLKLVFLSIRASIAAV